MPWHMEFKIMSCDIMLCVIDITDVVGTWFGKIKLQLMVWLIRIKLEIGLILNLVL
jgi:hypothetical protein